MKKILILLLLVSYPCLAEDSVMLAPGEKAPYMGYLLDPAKVKELRNNDIDLSLQRKVNDNLNSEIGDYQKRVDSYQKANTELADRLEKSNTNFLERTGFFMLGCVLTGLVSLSIYKTK